MPRRKYDSAQQAALDMLARVHMDKVQTKAVIRARIEADLREAVNDLELKESYAANVAFGLKVSKTDIGRALGTANFTTITDCLGRTAHDAVVADFVPVDPMSEAIAWDADARMFTVTIPDGTASRYTTDLDPEFGSDGGRAIPVIIWMGQNMAEAHAYMKGFI